MEEKSPSQMMQKKHLNRVRSRCDEVAPIAHTDDEGIVAGDAFSTDCYE